MAFLQIDYKSEALMRGVNIKVILPSDGMAGKWEPPYKTLYLLPGYSATATELITYLGLRGQSELKGIAIVLPDGENLFYQDLPDRMTFYSTYVGKELVEVTRKMLPLICCLPKQMHQDFRESSSRESSEAKKRIMAVNAICAHSGREKMWITDRSFSFVVEKKTGEYTVQ